MASPFSAFRKIKRCGWLESRSWPSVAFVFLTPAVMTSSGSGGREFAVVKTTKFGNIGQIEVQMMVANRRIFIEILQGIENPLKKQNRVAVQRVSRVIGPATNEAVIPEVALRPGGGSDGNQDRR